MVLVWYYIIVINMSIYGIIFGDYIMVTNG